MAKVKYSFCEPAAASSISRWHIRKLTSKGKMLGGGADTHSLCGRPMAWDLEVDIAYAEFPIGICLRCWTLYQEATK